MQRGSVAELVCGKPGDAPSKLVRAPYPGGDCHALELDFDLDVTSCQILPRSP